MALTFSAGQTLTATSLNAILPLYIDKTAGEPITSSTAMQNDDHLVTPTLSAGRTYRIQAVLAVTGAAAGDIKVDWTNTGTMTLAKKRACRGPDTGTADVTASAAYRSSGGHALADDIAYGCDGTNVSHITEEFVVAVTASGVVQMRWAQNASSGTATTVTADSYLILTPIS